ncbi:MAG: hypothetical protein WC656_00960 [Sulfurimonas sp.]
MKKAIKLLAFTEFFVLASYFISFSFYMNLQIAFLSSLFIILGSSFAYKKMVNTQVEADIIEEKRDFLDELEDPHGLYDDTPINEAHPDELDLRAIVQQEKKKIKLVNFKDMKNGSKAGFSLFRLIPYLFLVLGFIALKNNELLDIFIYLPSLLVGIIVGYVSGKEVFA